MTRTLVKSPAFLAAMGVLVLGAVALQVSVARMQVVLQKLPIYPEGDLPFRTISPSVPGWERVGQDVVLSKEVIEELGTENYLSRIYRGEHDGEPSLIELHLAYYTGMIDPVPHVPERCFVGGGMVQAGQSRVVDLPLDMDRYSVDPYLDPEKYGPIYTAATENFQTVRMPFDVERLKLRVTPFLDQRTDRTVYAGYFFLANGGWAASANDVRGLAFDLQNDYAYYAKVQFTSWDVESPEELGAVAADLLDELLPEIMRRVPDWIEVMEGRYPPDNPAMARAARG
ncbi:MAG: exosortase-associated EpsI family protein [Phycisphaerales bacterium]